MILREMHHKHFITLNPTRSQLICKTSKYMIKTRHITHFRTLNTLNGKNYAYGFGFGKTVMHHINTDSEALELLYPYPTLLPRVQENSLVSELLPSQRSSSSASRILDWLQNIKLKATPLPMVMVWECLISFISLYYRAQG